MSGVFNTIGSGISSLGNLFGGSGSTSDLSNALSGVGNVLNALTGGSTSSGGSSSSSTQPTSSDQSAASAANATSDQQSLIDPAVAAQTDIASGQNAPSQTQTQNPQGPSQQSQQGGDATPTSAIDQLRKAIAAARGQSQQPPWVIGGGAQTSPVMFTAPTASREPGSPPIAPQAPAPVVQPQIQDGGTTTIPETTGSAARLPRVPPSPTPPPDTSGRADLPLTAVAPYLTDVDAPGAVPTSVFPPADEPTSDQDKLKAAAAIPTTGVPSGSRKIDPATYAPTDITQTKVAGVNAPSPAIVKAPATGKPVKTVDPKTGKPVDPKTGDPLPTKPSFHPRETGAPSGHGPIARDVSGAQFIPQMLGEIAKVALPLIMGGLMGGGGGGFRGPGFGPRGFGGFGGHGPGGFGGRGFGHGPGGFHPGGGGYWPYHHPTFGRGVFGYHPGGQWRPMDPRQLGGGMSGSAGASQGGYGGGQGPSLSGQGGQGNQGGDQSQGDPSFFPSSGGSAPWRDNSFLSNIVYAESSGQNSGAPGGGPAGDRGLARGYYNIQTPTWREFARGVPGASQYASADQAPPEIQQAVAMTIPFKRFGSRTRMMLHNRFGQFNENLTLGQLADQFGGSAWADRNKTKTGGDTSPNPQGNAAAAQ